MARVGRKDSAQVRFAEDDDVIKAFPADRTDQSLRMKKLVAERDLEIEVMKEIAAKKW
jgi:hypothetical protein